MLPPGLELRPEFSTGSDVLAFGFSQKEANHLQAQDLEQLIDYVDQLAAASPPRYVIVDLRNIVAFDATDPAALLKLRHRLEQASWKLLLVLEEPRIRETLAILGLDKVLNSAGSSEIGRLVRAPVSPARRAPSAADEAVAFTALELAEILDAGITLDDAIRDIEKLRS